MPLTHSLNNKEGKVLDNEPDIVFLKSVFGHLKYYLDEFEFKKVMKRKKINQAMYAIAKKFGHKSSFHDLYLWHRDITGLVNQDDHIPIRDITSCDFYFRLVVLGRQSQGGHEGGQQMLNKVSLPNQIEIDINNFQARRVVRVTMELSGPALRTALGHAQWREAERTKLFDKLELKWGSTGVAYGTYSNEKGEEDYRVFRMFNGVMKVNTIGAGWIEGHRTGETRSGFMGGTW